MEDKPWKNDTQPYACDRWSIPTMSTINIVLIPANVPEKYTYIRINIFYIQFNTVG